MRLGQRLGLDLELHAVLPMKPEDYRADFASDVSRAKFDELVTAAAVREQMPHSDDRDEAYESAGRYIVDQSDIMIALWDGYAPAGRGGTAEIVGYARRRGVPLLVVPTTRANHRGRAAKSTPAGTDPAIRLNPGSEAFRRIDEYNRGSVQDRDLRRQLEIEEARLGEAAEGSAIHWRYEAVAAWALPRFVRADALALMYQRFYYRSAVALYGLAALAVTAVAAQSQFAWPAEVAMVEIAAMLGVLGTYGYAHSRALHQRWRGYRSLAEAFRSALYITLTGARDRHGGDRPNEIGEVDEPWYQRAFSEAWRQRPPVSVEPSTAAELARFLAESWIDDQIRYHREAVKRTQRQRKRLDIAVLVLFAMTIAVAALHASDVVVDASWTTRLIFLALALPSFGAALTGIRDQHQYRVHEVRSKRTAERLERLRRQIESPGSLRSVQKLAAETQALIESENLDWSGVVELQGLELIV
jgi:hypothetical protein